MSAVAAAAVLGLSGTAQAQVFTPSYQAPIPMNDLGVYLSDSPGDLTLEGIWRSGPIGLRVGYVDAEPDGLISLGGEVRAPIATSAPIDVAFTAGAQGLIGDVDALGLQAGLSIGHRFVNPGLALTPYIHPRIAAIDGPLDDDWNTELLAELGLDAEFSQNLIFRLSVGLSDESPDVGIGLAWRR